LRLSFHRVNEASSNVLWGQFDASERAKKHAKFKAGHGASAGTHRRLSTKLTAYGRVTRYSEQARGRSLRAAPKPQGIPPGKSRSWKVICRHTKQNKNHAG